MLAAWLAEHGHPPYRGPQILAWAYRRGASSFEEMSDLPLHLRQELASEFAPSSLAPVRCLRSSDGTRKLLFELRGSARIESVLVPDPPRLTLCISSQAGCGMGCTFCATARLGLIRNLTAAEIAGQVLAARRLLLAGERLTNIVFMGMGEPLANYDAVVQAIEILTANWGVGISARRITVSTVGLAPAIARLVRDTPVQVAVSLSATTDEQRRHLMPIDRRYPLEELMRTCRGLPLPQRRRITFEYVMLEGVNDSAEDAARLVRLLHGIRSKVNLIPFNPFPDSPYRASPAEVITAFQRCLLEAGVAASIRRSRGRDIAAACGQLALVGATQSRQRQAVAW